MCNRIVYFFNEKAPTAIYTLSLHDALPIEGEVVVRNGTFIKMDKAEVLREIKEQFARPVEGQAIEAKKLAQGLTPFVEEFYKDWGKAEITPHYGYNSRI